MVSVPNYAGETADELKSESGIRVSANSLIVREAVPADVAEIVELIKDLAVYVKEEEGVVKVTPEQLF